ncbi:MAG: hypothetical protein IPL46_33010 [Saprospiraceae bacterium]|nr:hypothetical protein [Saprospiraceae bacterium]
MKTSTESLGQEDLLAARELLCNTQQSNFSSFSEAILTTDFDCPYYSPIFVGIPADQIQPCGATIPSWPVVIAKLHEEELPVIPNERIDFTSCGGKMVTRTWAVTDPSGKKSSRQQLITFSDIEPPVLIIAGDTMVGAEQEIPRAYYEASDHGCSSFMVDVTEENVKLGESDYSIVRRYKAIDGCGNSTSRTQQIHVTKSEVQGKEAKQKSVSALEFRK